MVNRGREQEGVALAALDLSEVSSATPTMWKYIDFLPILPFIEVRESRGRTPRDSVGRNTASQTRAPGTPRTGSGIYRGR